MFSMLQMMIQESSASRITSYSSSTQPAMDSVMSTSLFRERRSPLRTRSTSSSKSSTTPEPEPPRVYVVRAITGSPPTSSTAACAPAEGLLVEVGDRLALVERDGRRGGNRLAQTLHPLAEQVAVLRRVDGVERRPHHLDVVLLQNSLLREFGGDVEPGLAAESGDDAVGLLDPDDFRDRLGRDRLDVHPVCGLGVGHDRRRVRVHQDDASAPSS